MRLDRELLAKRGGEKRRGGVAGVWAWEWMLKGVRNVNFWVRSGMEVSVDATFTNFTAIHTPLSLSWLAPRTATCNRRRNGSTIPGGVARIDTEFSGLRNGICNLRGEV